MLSFFLFQINHGGDIDAILNYLVLQRLEDNLNINTDRVYFSVLCKIIFSCKSFSINVTSVCFHFLLTNKTHRNEYILGTSTHQLVYTKIIQKLLSIVLKYLLIFSSIQQKINE